MVSERCKLTLLITATCFGPVVIVFLVLSFSTNYWLEFQVDRSKLSPTFQETSKEDIVLGRWSHTRNRGMFKECYPTNQTEFLDKPTVNNDPKIDGNCFYVHYGFPNSTISVSSEYISRIHLLRCHLAFYIIGLVLFILAYAFGLCLCCARKTKWAYLAGLSAYASTFTIAVAIACFHGAKYLEDNKIADEGPYTRYYIAWIKEVQNNTIQSYGWSYGLGWVGMILASINATLYAICGFNLGDRNEEEGRKKKKSRQRYRVHDRHPGTNSHKNDDVYYSHLDYLGYSGVPMYSGYSGYLNYPGYDRYLGYPSDQDTRKDEYAGRQPIAYSYYTDPIYSRA